MAIAEKARLPGSDGRDEGVALGAGREAEGAVLHIGAREDRAVRAEEGRSDPEAGVGGVGGARGLQGPREKLADIHRMLEPPAPRRASIDSACLDYIPFLPIGEPWKRPARSASRRRESWPPGSCISSSAPTPCPRSWSSCPPGRGVSPRLLPPPRQRSRRCPRSWRRRQSCERAAPIPFRLGDRYGYFTQDGTVLFSAAQSYGVALAEDAFAPYDRLSEGFSIESPGGRVKPRRRSSAIPSSPRAGVS